MKIYCLTHGHLKLIDTLYEMEAFFIQSHLNFQIIIVIPYLRRI